MCLSNMVWKGVPEICSTPAATARKRSVSICFSFSFLNRKIIKSIDGRERDGLYGFESSLIETGACP